MIYFGIADKTVFDQTAKWIGIDSHFHIDLVRGTGSWAVAIYDANKQHLLHKVIEVPYSGQSVTPAAIKQLTANKFNITYTGVEE